MFDLTILLNSLPLLVAGLFTALTLTATSVGIGFVLAVGVCVLQLSSNPIFRGLGTVYISIFRGVPLLIQLLFIYAFLPRIGLDVPTLISGIIGMSLCTSAYQAEYLRGGFLTVPKGQIESAEMLNLSPWTILARIEVPQVLRLTLPSLTNEAIMMVKASSLVSVVGITELTRMSQNLAASTFLQLQAYLEAAALYCIVNVTIYLISSWLESRTKLAET